MMCCSRWGGLSVRFLLVLFVQTVALRVVAVFRYLDGSNLCSIPFLSSRFGRLGVGLCLCVVCSVFGLAVRVDGPILA